MPKKNLEIDLIARLEKEMADQKYEVVDIDFLKPNDYNPNRQTSDEFAKLKRSIIENGFGQPVVAWKDGTIVDGEHRWKACKELGFKKIKVGFYDRDDIQAKLATIQFNEARGNEDMELLSGMFKEFEALGVLDKVQDQLLLDSEGIQRLLDYSGTVLDQFPGLEPGPAWEPAPTSTGQVDDYRTADGSEAQSVSTAAARPAAIAANSNVPGLGIHEAGYKVPDVRLARRIYVVTEEEGKLLDSVLGSNAAARMVEICQAIKDGKISI